MEIITSKNKLHPGKYIAFFDLDRTLVSVNSGKILIKTAYEKGYISRLGLIKAFCLSFLYKYELMDTLRIIDTMAGWLKGISETELNKLTEEIFEKQIRLSIRPEMRDEIKYHKNNGSEVIIMSSAIAAICKPVAENLGIDSVICSGLEVENGIFTGHSSGLFCFGEEKARRLIEFCESRNISTSDTWYYGDSIADLPVLLASGKPVCVSPDKKLLKEAKKRNWRVISC
jgi:HAD superfamily hydrolase (TIGR01490 family)